MEILKVDEHYQLNNNVGGLYRAKINKVTLEVSHLPQLVKVQKESLKETIELEQCYKLYNRVETEREIPKLEFIIDRNIKRSRQVNKQVGIAVEVHYLYYILQEFQYGKETVQTTTNNLGYRMGKFTKVRDKGIIQNAIARGMCVSCLAMVT